MSWTAPATVTVGQLMTAAFWNAQVRDNELFLHTVGALTNVGRASPNSAVTLTTSYQTVCTVTATTSLATATYLAIGNIQWKTSSSSSGLVLAGQLVVDGGAGSSDKVTYSDNGSANQSITTAQTWEGTITGAGSHTFALQATKVSNVGTWTADLYSSLTVFVFE